MKISAGVMFTYTSSFARYSPPPPVALLGCPRFISHAMYLASQCLIACVPACSIMESPLPQSNCGTGPQIYTWQARVSATLATQHSSISHSLMSLCRGSMHITPPPCPTKICTQHTHRETTHVENRHMDMYVYILYVLHRYTSN